jgi:rare lipoprotein A
VQVTRLDGPPAEVVVRINDRCAGKKKIIDVSEAAARRLDMMRAGIVPVRLRVVGPLTRRASGSAASPGGRGVK